MPLVNHSKQEINAKIVYFGPASGGKATNLHGIFKKLKKDCRGKMKTMNLQNEQMLFFDFVPPGQNASEGYQTRFHIYTLHNKVSSASAWKMLLKGVDGIVFVADSDPERMPDNLQALTQLKALLQSMPDGNAIPLIMQYNKRDAENPVPVEDMDRQLNPEGRLSIPAVAIRSDGVLDSLSRLVRIIMNSLQGLPAEGERVGSPVAETGPAPIEMPLETAPVPPSASILSLDAGEATSSGAMVTIPLKVTMNGIEKKMTITIALD